MQTLTKRLRVIATCALMAALTAAGGCTGEDFAGTGDLSLSVNGGGALRDGFPYYEGDVLFEVVDGWELQFTEYVLAIGDVELTDPEAGEVMTSWAGPLLVDPAKSTSGAEEFLTLTDIGATRHDFGFSFVEPQAGDEVTSADADDVQEMIDHGWSLLVGGEATREDEMIGFHVGLPVPTRYYSCINGVDKTDGIAIEADKTTEAYVYAHAIHLFWDTLATGDEDLRFDAWAAVAGEDGVVTADELATQDLLDLRDADGGPLLDTDGDPVSYNAGNVLDGHTLLDFVMYAARAGAHFNGVGLCRMEFLDD